MKVLSDYELLKSLKKYVIEICPETSSYTHKRTDINTETGTNMKRN